MCLAKSNTTVALRFETILRDTGALCRRLAVYGGSGSYGQRQIAQNYSTVTDTRRYGMQELARTKDSQNYGSSIDCLPQATDKPGSIIPTSQRHTYLIHLPLCIPSESNTRLQPPLSQHSAFYTRVIQKRNDMQRQSDPKTCIASWKLHCVAFQVFSIPPMPA